MITLREHIRELFIVITTFIITLSIFAFRYIEDVSWLEAIYFTVVTISTVGYNDITTQDSTKIITLILIIDGITMLGIASQLLVQRIVQFQLNRQYLLPTQAFRFANHIIVAGFGAKGRKVAQLFRDRGYTLIIVDLDNDRIKLAALQGYEIINGDITKPQVLRLLTLDNSAGLFLFLSDDNITIQAGIVSHSLSPNLDIYAELESRASYNVARVAGINKPISVMDFIANVVLDNMSHLDMRNIFNVKELRAQEASLGFIQIHKDHDFDVHFPINYPIGFYSSNLNEFHSSLDKGSTKTPPAISNHQIVAVNREDITASFRDDHGSHRKHNRIVFAGYGDFSEILLGRIEIPHRNIVVIYRNDEEFARLNDINCKKIHWDKEQSKIILTNLIEDNDLVISSFSDITDSLLLAINLKNLSQNAHLIQLVSYEYDIEPFINVGAETVITPQRIIADAVIQLFFGENQLPPSILFTNGHLFEHRVVLDDRFYRKKVKNIEKDHLSILLLRSQNNPDFHQPHSEHRIKMDDRLLIWVNHPIRTD